MPLGVLVLLVVIVATAAFALVRRQRDGRVSTQAPVAALVRGDVGATPQRPVLSAEDIGADLGEGATLVQVSSAFCAPCRAVRVLLSSLAEGRADVAYADVDAESHLGLVRRLAVMRTPTILVLDREGAIVGRATGVPRVAEIEAVLEGLTGPPISDNG